MEGVSLLPFLLLSSLLSLSSPSQLGKHVPPVSLCLPPPLPPFPPLPNARRPCAGAREKV